MTIQRFLHAVDRFSMVIGKTFSWLIVALMLLVCGEVFKRYALNAPTAWIFDANNMLYGTLFMMGGAYTLAQAGHVRGDFFYGSMKPRTQAALDLVLYALFFLPGVVALTWSGWTYFGESLAMREQTFNADPIPVYPFKFVIPVAGAVLLLQGFAEMVRCVLCLKTGAWTPRLKDAEEMDVVGEQLAGSSYVDEADKREVMEKAHAIEQAAQQRKSESSNNGTGGAA
ncbi:TRAP transporter small permease subunit [Variovorax sp. NFACC27]|uniref:TRAP transporter small permease subunit n=1 Tax=unclassified Variovorax TaxID=663243 RepID=UPI0008978788|nr:TRAP transporter small permease subunit [Variovorax sp. YR750]SEF33792.1 TRAP-type mannitol/chloroaromatic compound transport system, small permease component [Variovorax sp. NFACC28]SEG97035.1 TRAP-type mannitol/chloroaromatic compound transport system, small permease component [Variovorax sp. NFACC29]SFD87562.1 TRAP-type mannitol/chloroaromatic compound transport system, small permease component [Variovorax sp. NFACC26]SFH02454.1 TRAP-type mannitol/chloroaromatic compound transport system,